MGRRGYPHECCGLLLGRPARAWCGSRRSSRRAT
jgi:proteasome lid subunit RPN8/RPN11